MAQQGVPSVQSRSNQDVYSLLGMLRGMIIARAVHVAAKFRIADLLKDGPQPISSLAELSRTNRVVLHRLLAALATVGVFKEVEAGYFSNTEISTYLRSDAPNSLLDAALYWGSEWQWQTWGRLDYTVETGQRAFDHLFGTTLWDYLAQHPEEERIFGSALTSFSATLLPLIVRAYDFSGARTIVDVGGGQGSMLIALLAAYPQLQGILFDQQSVLRVAQEYVLNAGFADRCTLVPGDYFVSLPQGADIYLVKEVLHAWNDDHCLQILRNCRQAMAPGSKLLVIEHVYSPENATSFDKFLGLQMALEQEGHQRSEEEFRTLFQESGFQLQRIIPIPIPTTAIIEGIPV